MVLITVVTIHFDNNILRVDWATLKVWKCKDFLEQISMETELYVGVWWEAACFIPRRRWGLEASMRKDV